MRAAAAESRAATPVQASALLCWGGPGRGFTPCGTRADVRPDVRIIDSWLVEDGRVRALWAHAARFRRSCAPVAPILAEQMDAFFTAVAERLPRNGRWFPRVELAIFDETPRLRLWLRPAPPRGSTVRLWIVPEPDQRLNPTVKGPDLAHLAGLRETALAHGADEAVLLSPSGHVLEGASSHLMWWHGDVLCAPPPEGLLHGITQAILFDLAQAGGLQTSRSVPVRPADLAGCEVWAVNALHGIRAVTGWIGAAVAAASATRAAPWNGHLDRLAGPIRAA
jgi:branched-subunit amino acid aminotransferase/4-amino-4-deoxychorismate lyase